MIIDLSCYPTTEIDSAWRHDGDPFTGERLLKMMDGPYYVNGKPRRIDKAFITPPAGNTLHNFTNDHLDHRYGIQDGVDEFERHVKEHGFKMLQLHANMHAYRPDRAKDWVRPVLRKAEQLGVLVKLHTGD